MESADPRLISLLDFLCPPKQSRLGGSRSDLFAITLSIEPSQPLEERTNPFDTLVDVAVSALYGLTHVPLLELALARQHRHIGRSALGQIRHPLGGLLAIGDHAARTMNQQGPQVGVAAFADAQHADAPAGAGVLGHQAQPGGKLTASLAALCVAHRGYGCGGCEQAHTGNLSNATAGLVLFVPGAQTAFD